MADSQIELAVRVLRGTRTVFDSKICIPVTSPDPETMRPVVDQWFGLMDAALRVIPRVEEPL